MSISPQIAKLVFGGELDVPPAAIKLNKDDLLKYQGDYKLSERAQIRVSQEQDSLILTPIAQEAIDLLSYPDQTNVTLGKELNSRSEKILSAVLKDDFKPLEESLANKKRLERMRKFFQENLAIFKKECGSIKALEAVGTISMIPNAYGYKMSEQTSIQIKGEKGNRSLMFVWREGKLANFRRGEFSTQLRVPFLLLTQTEFAGYHLFIAKNLRLRFELDEKGVVRGIKIFGKNKEVFLSKKP